MPAKYAGKFDAGLVWSVLYENAQIFLAMKISCKLKLGEHIYVVAKLECLSF